MATAIVEPPHLETDLKTLCLATVAAQWRPLAELAARQRQAPADYLAQLVHLEVTERRVFGDDWRHDVFIESVRDGEADVDYPAFVDGGRRCPWEDVGGVAGFMEFS